MQVAMKTDIGRKQAGSGRDRAIATRPSLPRGSGRFLCWPMAWAGYPAEISPASMRSLHHQRLLRARRGEPPERLARAIAEANNLIFAESQGQERPTIWRRPWSRRAARRRTIIGSVGDSPLISCATPTCACHHRPHRRGAGARNSFGGGCRRPRRAQAARALGSLPSVRWTSSPGACAPAITCSAATG